MSDFAVIAALVIFVILAWFLWGSMVDGTFRREPSDWLGCAYVVGLVALLGYASKYLDEVRAHPYRSSLVVLVAVLLIAWSAIIMWRIAAKWDTKFYESQHRKHRHH